MKASSTFGVNQAEALRRRIRLMLFVPLTSAALAMPAQAQAPSQAGADFGLQTKPVQGCAGGSFETVPIFYADPTKVLESLGLVTPLTSGGCGSVMGPNIGSPKSVMIYGDPEGRKQIRQYIGSFDLPRERVHMDLWGVQISSVDKAKLSDVMDQVQRQVDQTREAMQLTYNKFSELSHQSDINPNLQMELVNRGFGDVLRDDPRLSLTQMLLRNAMANDPLQNYDAAALNICNFFAKNFNQIRFSEYNSHEGRTLKAYDNQRIFNDDPKRAFRRPFQGFMSLALHQRFDDNSLTPKCGDGNIGMSFKEALALEPKPPEPYLPANILEKKRAEYKNKFEALRDDPKKRHALTVAQGVQRRRDAIIRFAESYSRYQSYSRNRGNPDVYDPALLAKDASIVDGMLSPIVDAVNRDVEDYFIQPTLLKIRQIVGRNRGVEYAEVGRTTIAGINGNQVEVTTGTITSFDEPTPLRLNKWLTDAAAEQANVEAMFPNLKDVRLGGPASESFVGALPAPQAVLATLPATKALQLLSALSKEEVSWQALSSGIMLKLTPVVLRNQAQATVDVDLTISDPASKNELKTKTESDSATPPSDRKLRPLSRISTSIVKSKVYINTWDLFALSSFNNQTTITGRRWYVPLVGTIWEGAFGDIPIMGGWFSFKRPPQNIQHQSVILTNTLIVPSAMGMASYFNFIDIPSDSNNSNFNLNQTFDPTRSAWPSNLPYSIQTTPGRN
jgi:hypothetical protein